MSSQDLEKAAAAVDRSEDPIVGKVIDGCRVDRKIGQGGMGVVYLAIHEGLQQEFCIKILNPSLVGSEDTVERFFREAQACAQLNHPNIVAIQNVGKDGEYYFIRMEFVEGLTLEQMIKKQEKLEWRLATRMALETADALAHAHQKGMIHRDIKPENIMYTPKKEVRVMDFGLAKHVHSNNKVSVTGQIVGTPFFMSPEQAGGKPTDARSDLYSLGVTLYYLLTGTKPFNGKNLQEIFLKHFFYSPESPKTYTPDLPESLCEIVRKCLKKKKKERYQSAKALVRDLQQVLDDPDAPIGVDAGPAVVSQSPSAGGSGELGGETLNQTVRVDGDAEDDHTVRVGGNSMDDLTVEVGDDGEEKTIAVGQDDDSERTQRVGEATQAAGGEQRPRRKAEVKTISFRSASMVMNPDAPLEDSVVESDDDPTAGLDLPTMTFDPNTGELVSPESDAPFDPEESGKRLRKMLLAGLLVLIPIVLYAGLEVSNRSAFSSLKSKAATTSEAQVTILNEAGTARRMPESLEAIAQLDESNTRIESQIAQLNDLKQDLEGFAKRPLNSSAGSATDLAKKKAEEQLALTKELKLNNERKEKIREFLRRASARAVAYGEIQSTFDDLLAEYASRKAKAERDPAELAPFNAWVHDAHDRIVQGGSLVDELEFRWKELIESPTDEAQELAGKLATLQTVLVIASSPPGARIELDVADAAGRFQQVSLAGDDATTPTRWWDVPPGADWRVRLSKPGFGDVTSQGNARSQHIVNEELPKQVLREFSLGQVSAELGGRKRPENLIMTSQLALDPVGQLLYGVGHDGSLWAFDLGRTQERWHQPITSWCGSRARPRRLDGLVIAGTPLGELTFHDPTNGQELLQRRPLGSPVASDVGSNDDVSNVVVAVGTQNGKVFVIWPQDLRQWSFQTRNAVISRPYVRAGNPTLVLAGSTDDNVYALDPRADAPNKGEVSRLPLGADVVAGPEPVLRDQFYAVATADGRLHLLSFTENKLQLLYSTQRPEAKVVAQGVAGFTVDGSRIYHSVGNRVMAYQVDSGNGRLKPRWSGPFTTLGAATRVAVESRSDLVAVGSQGGSLYCLTADGELNWSQAFQRATIVQEPFVVNDANDGPLLGVVVHSADGLGRNEVKVYSLP